MSAGGQVIRDRVRRPLRTDDRFRANLCLKRLILHPTEVVVRRSALQGDLVFDPEVPGAEDWLLWIGLAQKGPFVAVGEPTVWMRMHPKGTFGDPEKFSRSLMRAAEKVIATGVPAELGIAGERMLAINRTHCAYAYYLGGQPGQAARWLKSAFRNYPRVAAEPDFWRVAGRLCAGRRLSRWVRAVRNRARGGQCAPVAAAGALPGPGQPRPAADQ
jgi:hypothetical protein